MRPILVCVFALTCARAMAVDFYEVNPNLVNEVGRSGSAIIIYKTGASDEAEKLCYKAGFVVLQRSADSRSLLCKAPVPSVLQLKLAELLSSPAVERVEPNTAAAAAPPKQIARPAPQPITQAQTKREVTGIVKAEYQTNPRKPPELVGYVLEVHRGTLTETFRIVLNDATNIELYEFMDQEVTVVAENGSRKTATGQTRYLFVSEVKSKQPARRLEKPIKPTTATSIQVRAR